MENRKKLSLMPFFMIRFHNFLSIRLLLTPEFLSSIFLLCNFFFSILLKPFSWSITEASMGLMKDRWEMVADCADRGFVKLCGIQAWEPMPAIAEEIVAKLSVGLHVKGTVE